MNRGIVTAELLNIRSYPGSRGKVIRQLDKNTVVDITDQVKDWYQIKFDHLSAYAASDYIAKLENNTNLRARVTASKLNVRSGPSAREKVIGQVLIDDVLDVIDEEGNWYEINFNNASGFVHRDYLQLIEGGHLQKGFVSVSLLNVRKKPTAKSEIAGKLVSGTEVDIVSESRGWYEIKFNQTTAYVSSRFVTKSITEDEARFFYQKERLKFIDLIPASLLLPGDTKEQRRVNKTWNTYGNLLQKVASSMDVDVGCVIAVLCVESGGDGVDKNGRMIIRFENHQFWKYWGKYNSDEFEQHFKFNDDRKWKGHRYRMKAGDDWQSFHGNQDKEWAVLDMARNYDDSSALKSISMGLPQVMGFNYKKIGYSSVQKMFENLNKDIRFQIFAMFDFLDNRMISALKNYEFERFAKYYNGPGQAADYGGWIQDHYDAYNEMINS